MGPETKHKRAPVKPAQAKAQQSATNQADYDSFPKQYVYLVSVSVLMPQTVKTDTNSGKEVSRLEQQTLGAQFVMYSEPTHESLILAAQNHPMLITDERFNMFLELLSEGIHGWGIPRFFGPRQGAELHTMETQWLASATNKGKGLRGINFGNIVVSRKVIV